VQNRDKAFFGSVEFGFCRINLDNVKTEIFRVVFANCSAEERIRVLTQGFSCQSKRCSEKYTQTIILSVDTDSRSRDEKIFSLLSPTKFSASVDLFQL